MSSGKPARVQVVDVRNELASLTGEQKRVLRDVYNPANHGHFNLAPLLNVLHAELNEPGSGGQRYVNVPHGLDVREAVADACDALAKAEPLAAHQAAGNASSTDPPFLRAMQESQAANPNHTLSSSALSSPSRVDALDSLFDSSSSLDAAWIAQNMSAVHTSLEDSGDAGKGEQEQEQQRLLGVSEQYRNADPKLTSDTRERGLVQAAYAVSSGAWNVIDDETATGVGAVYPPHQVFVCGEVVYNDARSRHVRREGPLLLHEGRMGQAPVLVHRLHPLAEQHTNPELRSVFDLGHVPAHLVPALTRFAGWRFGSMVCHAHMLTTLNRDLGRSDVLRPMLTDLGKQALADAVLRGTPGPTHSAVLHSQDITNALLGANAAKAYRAALGEYEQRADAMVRADFWYGCVAACMDTGRLAAASDRQSAPTSEDAFAAHPPLSAMKVAGWMFSRLCERNQCPLDAWNLVLVGAPSAMGHSLGSAVEAGSQVIVDPSTYFVAAGVAALPASAHRAVRVMDVCSGGAGDMPYRAAIQAAAATGTAVAGVRHLDEAEPGAAPEAQPSAGPDRTPGVAQPSFAADSQTSSSVDFSVDLSPVAYRSNSSFATAARQTARFVVSRALGGSPAVRVRPEHAAPFTPPTLTAWEPSPVRVARAPQPPASPYSDGTITTETDEAEEGGSSDTKGSFSDAPSLLRGLLLSESFPPPSPGPVQVQQQDHGTRPPSRDASSSSSSSSSSVGQAQKFQGTYVSSHDTSSSSTARGSSSSPSSSSSALGYLLRGAAPDLHRRLAQGQGPARQAELRRQEAAMAPTTPVYRKRPARVYHGSDRDITLGSSSASSSPSSSATQEVPGAVEGVRRALDRYNASLGAVRSPGSDSSSTWDLAAAAGSPPSSIPRAAGSGGFAADDTPATEQRPVAAGAADGTMEVAPYSAVRSGMLEFWGNLLSNSQPNISMGEVVGALDSFGAGEDMDAEPEPEEDAGKGKGEADAPADRAHIAWVRWALGEDPFFADQPLQQPTEAQAGLLQALPFTVYTPCASLGTLAANVVRADGPLLSLIHGQAKGVPLAAHRASPLIEIRLEPMLRRIFSSDIRNMEDAEVQQALPGVARYFGFMCGQAMLRAVRNRLEAADGDIMAALAHFQGKVANLGTDEGVAHVIVTKGLRATVEERAIGQAMLGDEVDKRVAGFVDSVSTEDIHFGAYHACFAHVHTLMDNIGPAGPLPTELSLRLLGQGSWHPLAARLMRLLFFQSQAGDAVPPLVPSAVNPHPWDMLIPGRLDGVARPVAAAGTPTVSWWFNAQLGPMFRDIVAAMLSTASNTVRRDARYHMAQQRLAMDALALPDLGLPMERSVAGECPLECVLRNVSAPDSDQVSEVVWDLFQRVPLASVPGIVPPSVVHDAVSAELGGMSEDEVRVWRPTPDVELMCTPSMVDALAGVAEPATIYGLSGPLLRLAAYNGTMTVLRHINDHEGMVGMRLLAALGFPVVPEGCDSDQWELPGPRGLARMLFARHSSAEVLLGSGDSLVPLLFDHIIRVDGLSGDSMAKRDNLPDLVVTNAVYGSMCAILDALSKGGCTGAGTRAEPVTRSMLTIAVNLLTTLFVPDVPADRVATMVANQVVRVSHTSAPELVSLAEAEPTVFGLSIANAFARWDPPRSYPDDGGIGDAGPYDPPKTIYDVPLHAAWVLWLHMVALPQEVLRSNGFTSSGAMPAENHQALAALVQQTAQQADGDFAPTTAALKGSAAAKVATLPAHDKIMATNAGVLPTLRLPDAWLHGQSAARLSEVFVNGNGVTSARQAVDTLLAVHAKGELDHNRRARAHAAQMLADLSDPRRSPVDVFQALVDRSKLDSPHVQRALELGEAALVVFMGSRWVRLRFLQLFASSLTDECMDLVDKGAIKVGSEAAAQALLDWPTGERDATNGSWAQAMVRDPVVRRASRTPQGAHLDDALRAMANGRMVSWSQLVESADPYHRIAHLGASLWLLLHWWWPKEALTDSVLLATHGVDPWYAMLRWGAGQGWITGTKTDGPVHPFLRFGARINTMAIVLADTVSPGDGGGDRAAATQPSGVLSTTSWVVWHRQRTLYAGGQTAAADGGPASVHVPIPADDDFPALAHWPRLGGEQRDAAEVRGQVVGPLSLLRHAPTGGRGNTRIDLYRANGSVVGRGATVPKDGMSAPASCVKAVVMEGSTILELRRD